MAIHSSTLAWKIPWAEEPDRLQSMGSQRVLEWIAISFSRGSSQPRNQTRVSRIAGRRFAVSSVKFGKFLDIIFSKNFFYIILFSFCDFSDMKDTSLLSCTSNTLLVIYSAFQIRKFSLICHQVH